MAITRASEASKGSLISTSKSNMNKILLDFCGRQTSRYLASLSLLLTVSTVIGEDSTNSSAASSQTERAATGPILSVVFDDPNRLFLDHPDGLSLLDFRNSSDIESENAATAVGGLVHIKVNSGDGQWSEDGDPPKAFVLLSKPDEGVNSALRIVGNKGVPGTSGVVRIVPQGAETSMGAMSSFNERKIFLNGGIDLFFRYSEEPPSMDLMPFIFSSQGGLHFVIHADQKSVIAILNDPQERQIFDTDLDGSADAARVESALVNQILLDPERFHHLAIWFQTAEDGTITMKVFCKGGAGPINTAEDTDLVSKGTFRIITDDTTALFEQGSLAIGPNSRNLPDIVHTDIAAFRIFAPAPDVFPDLAGKK
jgi:hypothetical protein